MTDVENNNRARDHLANERTFLAWIRTSIAMLSLGFVIAKFDFWLRELSRNLAPNTHLPHLGASMPMGIAMAAVGGLLGVFAAWRYYLVSGAIARGESISDRGMVLWVTTLVVLLSVAMILYLLMTLKGS